MAADAKVKLSTSEGRAHPACALASNFEWVDLSQSLRRLPARDMFRRIGERFAAERALPPEDVSTLCATLWLPSAWRWRQQELAVVCLSLAPLTPSQRRDAAYAILSVLRLRHWEGTASRHAARVARVAAVLAVVFLAGGGGAEHVWGVMALAQVIGMAALWPLSHRIEKGRMNRLRWSAAHALSRLPAPEAVAALADVAREHSGPGCAADGALRVLLPALSPVDTERLPTETVPNLCRLLTHENDALVRTVLAALEVVGDGSAADPVARVARRGRSELVREAAALALPVLRERQRREEATRTLLRAAAPAPESGTTLLRSTRPAEDVSQTLLRTLDSDHTGA